MQQNHVKARPKLVCDMYSAAAGRKSSMYKIVPEGQKTAGLPRLTVIKCNKRSLAGRIHGILLSFTLFVLQSARETVLRCTIGPLESSHQSAIVAESCVSHSENDSMTISNS